MRIVQGGKSKTPVSVSVRLKRKKFRMDPELAEDNYQPSEFLIPSHDAQGHGVRVTTMITPAVKRELGVIVAKGIVPQFGVEADVVRWCIDRGLNILQTRVKDPDVRNAHAIASSWIDMQRVMLETRYWADSLSVMKDSIQRLIIMKHYSPALRMVRNVEDSVDEIEDEYWRKQFQKDIVTTYAWLKRKVREREKNRKREAEDGDDE